MVKNNAVHFKVVLWLVLSATIYSPFMASSHLSKGEGIYI